MVSDRIEHSSARSRACAAARRTITLRHRSERARELVLGGAQRLVVPGRRGLLQHQRADVDAWSCPPRRRPPPQLRHFVAAPRETRARSGSVGRRNLGERGGDELVDRRRQRELRQRRRRRGLLVADLVGDRLDDCRGTASRRSAARRAPRRALNRSERASAVEAAALLGRHVRRRADHHAGGRQVRACRCARCRSRRP